VSEVFERGFVPTDKTAFVPLARLAAGKAMIHIAAGQPRRTSSMIIPADLAVTAWTILEGRICKLLPLPGRHHPSSTSESTARQRSARWTSENLGSRENRVRGTCRIGPCRSTCHATRWERDFAGVMQCYILVRNSLATPPSLLPPASGRPSRWIHLLKAAGVLETTVITER
jgi:hypothetical protein